MSIAKTNYHRPDIRPEHSGARPAQTQRELFSEFSQILEQIAVQISNTEEFSDLVKQEEAPAPSKKVEQKSPEKDDKREVREAVENVSEKVSEEAPVNENSDQTLKAGSEKTEAPETIAASLESKKEAEASTTQDATRQSEARPQPSKDESNKYLDGKDGSKAKKLSAEEAALVEAEQKAMTAFTQFADASARVGAAPGDRPLVNLFLQALLNGSASHEQLSQDQAPKTGAEILVAQFMMSQFAANPENFTGDLGRVLTGELRTVMAVSGGSTTRQNMGSMNSGSQARMKGADMSETLASRTLERVEEALREVAKSRDGKTISIRLDPPSLGSVKIDVTLKDGSLHARLMAESAQVSNLLREKAHDLQNMLRKMGLSVDSVSVSVNSDEGNGKRGTSFSEHQESAMMSQGEGEGSAVLKSGSPVQSSESEVLDHWVA